MTELVRSLSEDKLRAVLSNYDAAAFKTAEQGAATSVWCATSAQLEAMGGVYCEDVNIASAVAADSTEGTGVRPWATDPNLAERLWIISEELTGVRLNT